MTQRSKLSVVIGATLIGCWLMLSPGVGEDGAVAHGIDLEARLKKLEKKCETDRATISRLSTELAALKEAHSKLLAEHGESLTQLQTALRDAQANTATSTAKPFVLDPNTNTKSNDEGGFFPVEGLKVKVPRKHLPAMILVKITTQRPPLANDGHMQLKINDNLARMIIEPSTWPHGGEHNIVIPYMPDASGNGDIDMEVRYKTYNHPATFLDRSIIVIPLSKPGPPAAGERKDAQQ